ncbi:MAG: class II aldolase/adducin family protein [Treponema sp.]|jgi:rhamnose utilization protein RhaD (predicted bifunctional aldolase and dehydrogenase)|nr:class II aldolase/adducin family protein [Treponema sp.]
MSIEALVSLSRYYGSRPEYVVAGGGNTSFKDASRLFIKSSGIALAGICAGDFVQMDRAALSQIGERSYPLDAAEREAAVLADLLAARTAGEAAKRPSVETLVHDLLPFAYVVHTHPALVNGLTCSCSGEESARTLFGDRVLWIPWIHPGYALAQGVKKALSVYRAAKGPPPAILLLQNHGVFVGADSAEGIHAAYQALMDTLRACIREEPDPGEPVSSYGASGDIAGVLRELARKTAPPGSASFQVCFERNPIIRRFVRDAPSFAPLASPLTPDHIVYAGSDPLFIPVQPQAGPDWVAHLQEAWEQHLDKTGRLPKIAAVQGLGIFGIGTGEKAARRALELFKDALKVTVYAQAFGGVCGMCRDGIHFISTWEVEQYRSRVADIPREKHAEEQGGLCHEVVSAYPGAGTSL